MRNLEKSVNMGLLYIKAGPVARSENAFSLTGWACFGVLVGFAYIYKPDRGFRINPFRIVLILFVLCVVLLVQVYGRPEHTKHKRIIQLIQALFNTISLLWTQILGIILL